MSADSENEAARARSHVEELKEISDGLGGFLLDELADLSTDRISEDAYQLLKFHGSYQQDNRDERRERKKQGLDRAWSFMVRTKFPGGRLTAEQYLLADELASSYANNTLRITTRQDFQFHGVGKAPNDHGKDQPEERCRTVCPVSASDHKKRTDDGDQAGDDDRSKIWVSLPLHWKVF